MPEALHAQQLGRIPVLTCRWWAGASTAHRRGRRVPVAACWGMAGPQIWPAKWGGGGSLPSIHHLWYNLYPAVSSIALPMRWSLQLMSGCSSKAVCSLVFCSCGRVCQDLTGWLAAVLKPWSSRCWSFRSEETLSRFYNIRQVCTTVSE